MHTTYLTNNWHVEYIKNSVDAWVAQKPAYPSTSPLLVLSHSDKLKKKKELCKFNN